MFIMDNQTEMAGYNPRMSGKNRNDTLIVSERVRTFNISTGRAAQ